MIRQRVVVLTLGLLVGLGGCSSTGPGPSPDVYMLITIDGRSLPTGSSDLPDGTVLVAASLDFSLDPQLVRYAQSVKAPDRPVESFSIDLNYSWIRDSVAVDLCPPLALCFARTELVGTASNTELRLTHILGASPRSVYRFERSSRPR